jgi:hypothetical protein
MGLRIEHSDDRFVEHDMASGEKLQKTKSSFCWSCKGLGSYDGVVRRLASPEAKMFARAAFIMAMVLALGGGGARAQSAIPQRDAQQVIAAVERFVDAINAGDRVAIVNSISAVETSPRQREQRDIIASLIEAEKKLEREAQQRWGTDGSRLRCRFDVAFNEEDRKALRRAQVLIDDSAARVVVDGETSAMRVRRNAKGQWQVVIDIVDFEPDSDQPIQSWMESRSRIRRDRYRGYVDAVNSTLAKTQGGEFATAVAAEADLADRFAKISAEMAQRSNALNSSPFPFR